MKATKLDHQSKEKLDKQLALKTSDDLSKERN